MKVAIDARMYGTKHAGIGRYIKHLVDGLISLNTHQLHLIVHPDTAEILKHSSCQLYPTTIRHYTLREQVLLIKASRQIKADIWHYPHFNIPILPKRPWVVTIHDILWHQYKGSQVTTLNPLTYNIKYIAYRQIVNKAVTADEIIVPSMFVKQQLLKEFPQLKPDKVTVIYEGASSSLTTSKTITSTPYILYVGSAYPHKNLRRLISAMKTVQDQSLQLHLVSSRSVFLDDIKSFAKTLQVDDKLKIFHQLTDTQLAQKISQATALIMPSLHEGFGLPGIEAMSLNCPVLAAKAGSLPEIYGPAALYFDPKSTEAISDSINQIVANKRLRQTLIAEGRKQVSKYSWQTMVSQTSNLYSHVTTI